MRHVACYAAPDNMNTSKIISRVLPALVALAFGGCASAQDKAVTAEQASQDADQKMSEISMDTWQQEVDVQKKAAAESDRIAREGAKKMGEAGTASNQKAVEAVEALLKARGDVRDATSLRLDGFDKAVIDLRANIDKNLSKANAVVAKRGLRMKSEVVRKTIAELNASTIDTLAATKGRIDAQLVEFEAAIADMKKRVA